MAVVLYRTEGPMAIFNEPKRYFDIRGQQVTIIQDWKSHGVAAVVWEAAIALCFLLEELKEQIRGRRILELGTGTGLTGIMAVMLGGSVTMTDKGDCLETARVNVNLNKRSFLDGSNHTVEELTWGSDLEKWREQNFDFVIGADIIYIESTFPALLRTLLAVCRPQTRVLLSYRIRYERDQRFLDMFSENFHWELVRRDEAMSVDILEARLKSRPLDSDL